jgi:TatA/E family protein of Tat protein translocase
MFGLGVWEIAVIAVVALLVLGPDKLPSAAKSLGKALRDFRRAGDDIKQQMMGDIDAPVPPRPPIAVQKPEGQVAANPPGKDAPPDPPLPDPASSDPPPPDPLPTDPTKPT